MEYITSKQVGDIWGISSRRVAILCKEGRITGAKKMGILGLYLQM